MAQARRPDPVPHPLAPAAFARPAPAAGSFAATDTACGVTAEQRMARLRDLLAKGILTEPELRAKRQEIVGQH